MYTAFINFIIILKLHFESTLHFYIFTNFKGELDTLCFTNSAGKLDTNISNETHERHMRPRKRCCPSNWMLNLMADMTQISTGFCSSLIVSANLIQISATEQLKDKRALKKVLSEQREAQFKGKLKTLSKVCQVCVCVCCSVLQHVLQLSLKLSAHSRR